MSALEEEHHCRPATKCLENIALMSNIIKPYDKNRSQNCAVFIRDYIGINNVVQKIFIDQLNFNLHIIDCDTRQSDQTVLESRLNELNKNITENKDKPFVLVFLTFSFDMKKPEIGSHINIIFIDNQNNKYYYYEPHLKYYYIQESFNKLPIIVQYKKENIPESILTQSNLPFCYMYCLHFFLFLLIEQKNKYKLEKYTSSCDNLYIMRFIRDIIKLCHLYKLIDYNNLILSKRFDYIHYDDLSGPKLSNQDASDLLYYLLTNNTYKVKAILDKNITIQFKIKYALQLISSNEVEEIISNKIHDTYIHYPTEKFIMYYLNEFTESHLELCNKHLLFVKLDEYLTYAIKHKYNNIISFYVDNYKKFYGGHDGQLMHYLVVDDIYLSHIEKLLSYNYDIHQEAFNRLTAIHIAIKNGSYLIVRRLILHDNKLLEDINLLRIACVNRLKKNSDTMILIIKLLLDNGLDINNLDDESNTIIHNSEDLNIIKFIVSKNNFIHVNKQNKYDNETILYQVSTLFNSNESVGLLRFLLDNGATKSITLKTAKNTTSLNTDIEKKQILTDILSKCTNPIKNTCIKEDLEDNYYNFDYNYTPEYDSSNNKIQVGKGYFSNQYIYHLDSDPSKKVIVKKLILSNILRNTDDECGVLLKIKNKYEHLNEYVSEFKFAFINPNNEYFIVSEYDENTFSLDHFFNNPLSEEEKKEIINNLIKSVVALHNNEIVHLDIKPSNIIYNQTTKKLKLIDFGNSCIKENKDCKLITSIPYHPHLIEFPIISDSKFVNPTFDTKMFIDLYSLGITIYHIIVGNGFPQKENKTNYEYTKLVLDEALKKFTELNLSEYIGLISNMYDRLESIIKLSKAIGINYDTYYYLRKTNYLSDIIETDIYSAGLDLSKLIDKEISDKKPYSNLKNYSTSLNTYSMVDRYFNALSLASIQPLPQIPLLPAKITQEQDSTTYVPYDPKSGGNINMKNKYLKYKSKYLKLKQSLKN